MVNDWISSHYALQYKNEIQQLTRGLNVIDLTGLPVGEVKKRVAALPSDAVIAYTPIYTDETGRSHNPGEVLEVLAKAANRPIVVDSENSPWKGRGRRHCPVC